MSLESSERGQTYEEYRGNGGSLSFELYDQILHASYSEVEFTAAFNAIRPAGLPDNAFVEMAAKIIHVLGVHDERVQRAMAWLIPETYIFLGRM